MLLLAGVIFTARVCDAAITDPEVQLKEVGITSMLGNRIDLSAAFINEHGEAVTLGSLIIPGRPLIVVPAYYTCPRLCGLLLKGVTGLLSDLTLKLGTEFSVVTVSFNPEDTTERARTKAAEFRAQVTGLNGQNGVVDNWHFLIGTKENSGALMKSLGFHFKKDEQEYSHTAAIFAITPTGAISQFFAGISFQAKDVRYGLIEASQGAIGSVIDQVFLFCFNYDHIAGKYVWAAFGVMRTGGVITLLLLSYLIYRLYKTEKSRKALGSI